MVGMVLTYPAHNRGLPPRPRQRSFMSPAAIIHLPPGKFVTRVYNISREKDILGRQRTVGTVRTVRTVRTVGTVAMADDGGSKDDGEVEEDQECDDSGGELP